MKERFLKVVKCFLIILGILFLFQLILIIGAIIGVTFLANINPVKLDNFDSKINYGEIQPVVNYVENYYKNNNKFPQKIENVKVNKNLNYTYSLENDGECYIIKANNKKTNSNKEYKNCISNKEDSNSFSRQYVEYVEKH